MHCFQDNSLFRGTLVLFVILALYTMNYLVAPGGLTLLGFQQWVIPTLHRSSFQQQIIPTSMIMYTNASASAGPAPDRTNSTTLLIEDKNTTGKTIDFKESEVVMITPLTMDLEDLGLIEDKNTTSKTIDLKVNEVVTVTPSTLDLEDLGLIEDKNNTGKTIDFKENEVVMVTPSTLDLEDLGQCNLTGGSPGAENVSNSNNQDWDSGKSSREEGLVLQGDNDPQQGTIQEGEVKQQTEEEKAKKGSEMNETIVAEMSPLSLPSPLPSPPQQEETTKKGSEMNETIVAEISPLSLPSPLPSPPQQEETAKKGSEMNETIVAKMSPLSLLSPLPSPPLHNRTMKENMHLWLPRVAALLSKCASAAPISIVEYLAKKSCPRNCTGNGVCNHELAKCQCFHGYTGAACNFYKDFECNMKYSSNVVDQQGVFGPRLPSICPATCDKRKGFCYCGETTNYSDRPTSEQCGFRKIVGTVITFNWTIGDPDIYTNNKSIPGWCNLDPVAYKEGTAQKREDCFCIYDGLAGDLCEYHTESSCVNQCSRNGFCRNGFCACEEGWYGLDCSIPSVKASMKAWPSWLSSDTEDTSDQPSHLKYNESDKISVQRRRPLVYVYDLPPQFNNLLLEGRHYKFHCVNRIYDVKNWTVWSEALYGAENAFLESLLASKHRTNNAQEADFFYVPVLGACAIARAGDSPHMDIHRKHYGIRPYFAGDVYNKKAYQHIKKHYPYWDRFGGRDHIWMFAWDEGACVSPKEIWNSMMLVHWGNTNSKYNDSTTTYGSDNWNIVPKYWRGNHPCYDPEKDLVLPSWKNPDLHMLNRKLWKFVYSSPSKLEQGETLSSISKGDPIILKIDQRPTLFYFRGNLGSKYKGGRPEPKYSMGIRQRVAEEFGTDPDLEGRMGRRSAPDVKVVGGRTDNYSLELASSRFCGVFPGDGWSGRLEDSILHGCIPVIIQDGIHLPFENVLDYSQFAVRIAEEHLPIMLDILRSIPEEQVEKMQSVVQTLWQRFTYHNAIRLEAERQLASGNKSRLRGWTQFKDLRDDDAFDTFIQVLHYKLIQRSQASETTKTDIQHNGSVNCQNYSYDLK